MLQTTTKHSHWQAARDVQAGRYFKYHGKWHLAITDAVRPRFPGAVSVSDALLADFAPDQ